MSKAIIIGSGYLGLEISESLVKRNINVQIIEREGRPLPGTEEEFSDEILRILVNNRIEFVGNVIDIEPVISVDKLLGVNYKNKFVEADLVLLAIGFEPSTYLAHSAKLELGKYDGIKIDHYFKTSDRFIYAAGDNVEIVNAVTGKPEYIPLATHSYLQGHIAGENAAGGNSKYDAFVKNISVKIFDKFFTSVGLSSVEAVKNGFDVEEAFAKARNLVGVMPGSDYVIGKVLADRNSKRIIGGSFLGGQEVSGYSDLISALIKMKIPASILSKINYNYTPPLSPFINLLSIIGKKFSDSF